MQGELTHRLDFVATMSEHIKGRESEASAAKGLDLRQKNSMDLKFMIQGITKIHFHCRSQLLSWQSTFI